MRCLYAGCARGLLLAHRQSSSSCGGGLRVVGPVVDAAATAPAAALTAPASLTGPVTNEWIVVQQQPPRSRRRRRDPAAPGDLASVASRLNAAVCSCKSADSVFQVHEELWRDFTPVNLATAAHRLAKLNAPQSSRLKRLLGQALGSLEKERWSGRSLANFAWAVSRLGGSSGLANAIAASAMRLDLVADFERLPMLLQALAKMHDDPCFFAAAREAVVQSDLGAWSPQGLSATAWAFATVGEHDTALFDVVATASVAQIAKFNAQDLATLAWSIRTAGYHYSKTTSRALSTAALREMPNFTEHGLSNLAWALAPRDDEDCDDDLFDAIADASYPILRDFSPRGLSTLAWAYARYYGSQRRDPFFLREVQKVALLRVYEFEGQSLSNIAWAVATAGVGEPNLFAAISHRLRHEDIFLEPQHVANLAWAFNRVKFRDAEFFAVLAEKARPHEMIPQELATLTRVFGQLAARPESGTRKKEAPCCCCCSPLAAAIAESSLRQLDDFTGQGISVTMRGLAFLNVEAPELFEAVARVAPSMEFTSQNFADLAMAYSKAGIAAPALFECIARNARLADFDTRSLANLAWALATAGPENVRPPYFFAVIAQQAIQNDYSHDQSHDIAKLTWALARAHQEGMCEDISAILTLARVMKSTDLSFDAHDLSKVAWAFALVNYSKNSDIDRELFHTFKKRAQKLLDEKGSEEEEKLLESLLRTFEFAASRPTLTSLLSSAVMEIWRPWTFDHANLSK